MEAAMNRAFSLAHRWGGPAALVVPLLAAYLYLGACGAGKHGFVLGVRLGGVSITAAWCA
jgi:hypothetical protein